MITYMKTDDLVKLFFEFSLVFSILGCLAFPEYLAGKEITSVAVDFLQDDLDERGRERNCRLSVVLTKYIILDHQFLNCGQYLVL